LGKGRLTIIVVVTNNKLLQFAVFAKLTPDIFVEGVEVVLQLRRIHSIFRIVSRVLVEVGHQDRLAVGRLDMFSRAAIAMAASTDFLRKRGQSQ
jgi:hypothetical protein